MQYVPRVTDNLTPSCLKWATEIQGAGDYKYDIMTSLSCFSAAIQTLRASSLLKSRQLQEFQDGLTGCDFLNELGQLLLGAEKLY